MERQIRYCVEVGSPPSTQEETLRWNVLVINDERGITRVCTRLRIAMPPMEDFDTLTFGEVPRSRILNYRLVSFFTHDVVPREFDWKKVYRGRVLRDPNLVAGGTANRLSNYVDNAIKFSRFS